MSEWENNELEEESSFSNTKGFFQLTSQLMYSISYAEINNETQKLHDYLESLYGWLIPNYDDQEKKMTDYQLSQAQHYINQSKKYSDMNLEKKSQEQHQLAKQNLRKVKHSIVEKMHDKNLLYPIREKGSALWN